MLGYFPVPYKDELLYSVIARYKLHQGIIINRQVVSTLFGSRDVASVVDFPGHLLELEKNTYHLTHMKAVEWLSKHTLYPAYKHFLPISRIEKLNNSMLSGRAWDVHTRIGVSASNIKTPKYLRLCKHCYLSELQRHGEPYWHRLHQLSGVIVCPIHKEYLYESDTLYRPQGKYDFLPAINASLVRQIPMDLTTKQKQKIIQLSQNIEELINLDTNYIISLNQWSAYYRQLAENHGFNIASRVDHNALASHIKSYWSNPLLDTLGLTTSYFEWLKNLFRKHRKSFHYLYHLATWQALDNISPRICLACAQKISATKRKQEIREVKIESSCLNKKRKEWKSAVSANQTQGVKWLRTDGGFSALYAWLYRNDRLWLQKNKPDSKPRNTTHLIINWNNRDKNILKHLRCIKVAGSLNNNDGRRSISWLIKQSGQRALLEKNQDKLPKTTKFIKNLAESPDSYRRRRIEKTVYDLHKNNQLCETWVIFRKAGIRKEFQTKSITRYINKLKRKLHFGSSRFIPQNT